MRYYYLKDNKPAYSLKAPIGEYDEIENKEDYVLTDEETFNRLVEELTPKRHNRNINKEG